jgi:hypothetical protein
LAGPEPIVRADVSTIRLIRDVLGVGLDDFFRHAAHRPPAAARGPAATAGAAPAS